MTELEPQVKEQLERRLRAELEAAATEAPTFHGLREPAHAHRRVRQVVVIGAVSACTVLVAGAVGMTWLSGQNELEGTSCAPATLRFNGEEYNDVGDFVRFPVEGKFLGEGVVPGCDDGNGVAPDRRMALSAVKGADPDTAVIADGTLWVSLDNGTLPELAREARRPVSCNLKQTTTVIGDWINVTGGKEPRFDGDARPPYTIGLVVRDDAVVPAGWESVVLQVSVTESSKAPNPDEVKKMLWTPAPAEVTMHCDGDRFVADSLSPA